MDIYQVLSIGILVLFYLEFAIAKFSQSEKGAPQGYYQGRPASRRARLLGDWQKVLSFVIVIVQIVCISGGGNLFKNMILTRVGIGVASAGVLVFTLTVLTSQGEWNTEAGGYYQNKGIYRYSRNPVALGFLLLDIGVCLAFFQWFLLFVTVATVVVYHLKIRETERIGALRFGMRYSRYLKSSCRYFGLKRKAAKTPVKPRG